MGRPNTVLGRGSQRNCSVWMYWSGFIRGVPPAGIVFVEHKVGGSYTAFNKSISHASTITPSETRGHIAAIPQDQEGRKCRDVKL
jgi:hypothetical protein